MSLDLISQPEERNGRRGAEEEGEEDLGPGKWNVPHTCLDS